MKRRNDASRWFQWTFYSCPRRGVAQHSTRGDVSGIGPRVIWIKLPLPANICFVRRTMIRLNCIFLALLYLWNLSYARLDFDYLFINQLVNSHIDTQIVRNLWQKVKIPINYFVWWNYMILRVLPWFLIIERNYVEYVRYWILQINEYLLLIIENTPSENNI